MCILASPALGPGVAVERRRVAAPVAAATARAPGRHGVRAAPGGAAHGAARPGDFVGGAWGGAGARGPASDGGGGGVRGQRARAAQGPPHVPPPLLLGEPRPRAPAAPPSRGGGGDKTPRASSASPGSTSPTSSRQRPRPGSPGAAVATRPLCCSSPPPLASAPVAGDTRGATRAGLTRQRGGCSAGLARPRGPSRARGAPQRRRRRRPTCSPLASSSTGWFSPTPRPPCPGPSPCSPFSTATSGAPLEPTPAAAPSLRALFAAAFCCGRSASQADVCSPRRSHARPYCGPHVCCCRHYCCRHFCCRPCRCGCRQRPTREPPGSGPPPAPAAAADAILHPYFTANFSDRLVASGDLLRQDEKLEALRALIRQVPRGGNGRPSFFHLTKAFAKCLTRALGLPPAGFRGACALCGS